MPPMPPAAPRRPARRVGQPVGLPIKFELTLMSVTLFSCENIWTRGFTATGRIELSVCKFQQANFSSWQRNKFKRRLNNLQHSLLYSPGNFSLRHLKTLVCLTHSFHKRPAISGEIKFKVLLKPQTYNYTHTHKLFCLSFYILWCSVDYLRSNMIRLFFSLQLYASDGTCSSLELKIIKVV